MVYERRDEDIDIEREREQYGFNNIQSRDRGDSLQGQMTILREAAARERDRARETERPARHSIVEDPEPRDVRVVE